MSEKQGVVRAFLDLEPIVELILAGEHDLKKEALTRVFHLNTQIGKVAATNPGRRAELQRLQLAVNAVTSSIKRDDAVLMRESFEGVRSEVRGLARL